MTLRELARMAEAREAADWTRTSHTMALIANCNRDSKRRAAPYRPADFYPLPLPAGERRSASGATPVTPETIDMLKLFVDR